MNKTVLVTEELIQRGKSKAGAWTKRQLAILGVSWPPQKGWKTRVVLSRLQLSESEVEEFLGIGKRQLELWTE